MRVSSLKILLSLFQVMFKSQNNFFKLLPKSMKGEENVWTDFMNPVSKFDLLDVNSQCLDSFSLTNPFSLSLFLPSSNALTLTLSLFLPLSLSHSFYHPLHSSPSTLKTPSFTSILACSQHTNSPSLFFPSLNFLSHFLSHTNSLSFPLISISFFSHFDLWSCLLELSQDFVCSSSHSFFCKSLFALF